MCSSRRQSAMRAGWSGASGVDEGKYAEMQSSIASRTDDIIAIPPVEEAFCVSSITSRSCDEFAVLITKVLKSGCCLSVTKMSQTGF